MIICNEGLENLRYAIVRQAVMDYNSALRFLRKPGCKQKENYYLMLGMKEECERFFRSQTFATMCYLDGEEISTAVRRKSYNRPIKFKEKEV